MKECAGAFITGLILGALFIALISLNLSLQEEEKYYITTDIECPINEFVSCQPQDSHDTCLIVAFSRKQNKCTVFCECEKFKKGGW